MLTVKLTLNRQAAPDKAMTDPVGLWRNVQLGGERRLRDFQRKWPQA